MTPERTAALGRDRRVSGAELAGAGADLARRTRRAQGLGPTVEDPSALAELAGIAAAALKRAARRPERGGTPLAGGAPTTSISPSSTPGTTPAEPSENEDS